MKDLERIALAALSGLAGRCFSDVWPGISYAGHLALGGGEGKEGVRARIEPASCLRGTISVFDGGRAARGKATYRHEYVLTLPKICEKHRVEEGGWEG